MTETKHTPTIDDKWIVTATVLCERLGIAPKADAEHIVSGINRLRNSRTALVEALRKLAALHDCGCWPCTGQCRTQEALAIQIDAMRGIADAALAGEKDAPKDVVQT